MFLFLLKNCKNGVIDFLRQDDEILLLFSIRVAE